MPSLTRRHVPKLLHQVEGRQHASEDDHDTSGPPNGAKAGFQLPTPVSSNSTRSSRGSTKSADMDDIDIYADPLSSDDEKAQALKQAPTVPPPPAKEEGRRNFKPPPQLDGFQEPLRNAPATLKRPTRTMDKKVAPPNPQFRRPAVSSSPPSTGSKRSSGEWENGSSDNDAMIFPSSQTSQVKRQRTAPVTANLHALPPQTKAKGYGQKAQRQRSREEEQKKAAEAKLAKEAEVEKAKGPKFRQANLPSNMLAFHGRDANTVFKQPGKNVSNAMQDCEAGADDYRADSPDLSDLSSPPVSPPPEAVALYDLPSAVRQMECAICGANVPATMREEYEDLYAQVKQWNYKWQQRFCRYHKQTEASQLWEERGYPKIDWIRLDARLRQRKHMTHVRRIISGDVISVFRKQFQARVKSRAKTLLQIAEAENAGRGASAGYYGPRGEKLMTDHIISSFADDLRSHATEDTLVAASGVSGGVSGFVQSVLVPELAVSLIREDLGPKSQRDPVTVLEESAEVGEVLCPELEDEVRFVDEVEGS